MPDAHRYDDIIDLPHPTSAVHPRMPMLSRAAQFAPYATLKGFGDAIIEHDRLVEARIELSEEERLALGKKLERLSRHIAERPQLTALIFQPDARKEGGRYIEITGRAAKVCEAERRLVLEDGTVIPFDDILDIESNCSVPL